jgi:hypothetical protein
MSVVLFVRVASKLGAEELEHRVLDRRPDFLEVKGLIQKIYGRDPVSGDWCGIYFFENQEALAAFRETELAKSIPAAYEATEVRREVFEVMYPLRSDIGPVEE